LHRQDVNNFNETTIPVTGFNRATSEFRPCLPS